MIDPIIFRRNDSLSISEAVYWKDLLYRVIKIGTEIEVTPPKGCEREVFENALREKLSPSGDFDHLGKYGVLDVLTEHCGVELRIIGRQPSFRNLQKQYLAIIDVLKCQQARARAICGLHFHLLTPGLAEAVPEIILANLWNLTRRYAPELKYLTSGGENRAGLCRHRQYNSHLEMIRQSPGFLTMAEIQNALKKSLTVPEHQNFLNLENVGFVETGAVLPFHLEFRFPDADISPTSVTAKAFLFLAMVIKSVDLSQYGVIHVGKIAPWRRKTELLDLLSNNDGNLATSDTTGITDEIIDELRQGCYELLDFLTPTFDRLEESVSGDTPALDVLLALAEQPISLRRSAGYDWDEIEAMLAKRTALEKLDIDETDRRLMQRIELGEWANKYSMDTWKWRAGQELSLTPQDLEFRLQKLKKLRGLRWDSRKGTLVFLS